MDTTARAELDMGTMVRHCCEVKADKRYQLADWRLRPLTDEMVGYARGDTHHLLYVYDRLKQQLAAGSAASMARDNVTKAGPNTRSIFSST